ncbi:hypothetical protein AYO40_06490, partial [Planctomycetaceae bacterium SCGC AG-212-D15]
MAACTRCNVCAHPGTLSEARDIRQVPCNVRCFRDEAFTLWRCVGCGSIHCAEDADLERFYADYPLKQQQLTFHERIGYRNRLRWLECHGLRQRDRILDYGCGAGLFVQFLRDHGLPRVLGYDAFVPEFADPAVLGEPYDVVVSYDVIEHDDDPHDFLARLTSLVRPGGLLVIGTPNAEHVSLDRISDPALHAPYHRHILSENALVRLGREHGLDTVEVQRRSFYDSLYPTVNSRFMWQYIARCGHLDAVNEPPRTASVLLSPTLVFLAFFGYFWPRGDNMVVTFRRGSRMAAA